MVRLEGMASPRRAKLDPAGGQAHPRMQEGQIVAETAAHNCACPSDAVHTGPRAAACHGRDLVEACRVVQTCACPSDAAHTGPRVAACHGRDLVEACPVDQTPMAVGHWGWGRNCPAVAIPGYKGRHSERGRGVLLTARASCHSLFHNRARLTALEAAAQVPCTGQTFPHRRQQCCLLVGGHHCFPPVLALARQLCWHRLRPRCCRHLASSCGHGRRYLLVPSPPQEDPLSSGPICVEPP